MWVLGRVQPGANVGAPYRGCPPALSVGTAADRPTGSYTVAFAVATLPRTARRGAGTVPDGSP
jgi:hypothetical protein